MQKKTHWYVDLFLQYTFFYFTYILTEYGNWPLTQTPYLTYGFDSIYLLFQFLLLMKSSDEKLFSYLTIFDNIKSINFIVNLFNNNLFLIFSCDLELILSICNGGSSIYSSSSSFFVSLSRFLFKLSSFFFKHQYLLYVNLVSCLVYHLCSLAY